MVQQPNAKPSWLKQDITNQAKGKYMYSGGCLCNAVRFEVDELVGPFELCHCTRCRKSTGSAFAAMVGIKASKFRIVKGRSEIQSIELPIIEKVPAYRRNFCSKCGSPVPFPESNVDWLEVPAGLFDNDLPLNPERHIYIELKANWEKICDKLPSFTKATLAKLRSNT